MTDQRADTDPRGFVRLTLNNGDTREVHGYGVDVEQVGAPNVSGGQNEAGRAGTLYFSLLSDNADVARPTEPSMQTIPGTRRVLRFDRVRYFNPNVALGGTPVTITVLTLPRSAWVDSDPSGVARFRFLTRSGAGGISLFATGDGLNRDVAQLYINNGQLEDRYWVDEEFDVRHYWHGLITAEQNFEVYVVTKGTAFDPLRTYVQKFLPIDYTAANVNARMLAAAPAVTQRFVCDFTAGLNANRAANTNIRTPIPSGLFEMYVVNLAAVVSRCDYLIGCVGHQ